MISTLKLNRVSDGFLSNASNYLSNPTPDQIKQIKWIEEQVVTRSAAFLSDPNYYSMLWEDLTDEEFPEQYLKEFPMEIDGWWIGAEGSRGVTGISMSILPLKDELGKTIDYPQSRLCEEYLKRGRRVYILKEKVFKELVG